MYLLEHLFQQERLPFSRLICRSHIFGNLDYSFHSSLDVPGFKYNTISTFIDSVGNVPSTIERSDLLEMLVEVGFMSNKFFNSLGSLAIGLAVCGQTTQLKEEEKYYIYIPLPVCWLSSLFLVYSFCPWPSSSSKLLLDLLELKQLHFLK